MKNLALAGVCALALSAAGLSPAKAQGTQIAQTVVSGTVCPTTAQVNVGSARPVVGTQLGALCVQSAGVPAGGATHAQTTALASNLVVKASVGTLFSFTISADTTLNAAQWYVMIFDATSLPVDGAVTPAKCYAMPAGVSVAGGTFDTGGVALSTGIVVGVSTTGCFTKTASTHALFIGADYQ